MNAPTPSTAALRAYVRLEMDPPGPRDVRAVFPLQDDRELRMWIILPDGGEIPLVQSEALTVQVQTMTQLLRDKILDWDQEPIFAAVEGWFNGVSSDDRIRPAFTVEVSSITCVTRGNRRLFREFDQDFGDRVYEPMESLAFSEAA